MKNKKTKNRKIFKTHKQRYFAYIDDLKKNKGLIDSHCTVGFIPNSEELYKEMLKWHRVADNPKNYTVITSL